MSNVVPVDFNKIEAVLIGGDLSRLSSQEKVSYYNKVCDSIGLNYLTKPFEYIKLNGKEVLYATRSAADQLRKVNKVALRITARELMGDVYVVTAQASTPDGRTDESTGAVPIQGLKGEALANAYMKAETKAKRRVTLSICGLGMLDETEVESITQGPRDARVREVQSQLLERPEVEAELQVDPIDAALASEAVAPALADYKVLAGKHKGKLLSEISKRDLEAFVDWFNDMQAKDPQFKAHPNVQDYYERTCDYLALLGGGDQ